MLFISWCRFIIDALRLHLARLGYLYVILLAVVLILGSGWLLFVSAPSAFPINTVIDIPRGQSVSKASYELQSQNIVRSPLVFKIAARLMGGSHGVQSGKYAFNKPVNAIRIAWNLTHGISGIPTIRVTFPEGTTVRQMGKILGERIPGFSEERFDEIALPAEGYLFPDTYFFLPDTTEAAAMDIMRANYDAHAQDLGDAITAFGKPEREVIIMASLLEAEGKTTDDRRTIAGILWHRLALGMPLQVDATFGYVHGVSGYAPTASDLKEKSAYNTYLYKGLPPAPINNPGEEAIRAAVTPIQTEYLYYLTGTDGTMHYAKTLAEHVENQRKYLK
ncbi:MAG: endolytic transglycosylase MltG [Bacillota bacterium]